MAKVNSKQEGYSADSVRALTGLEVIRNNISMYIGSTDSDALFTLAREPLDNAVDEALAGRNDEVFFRAHGTWKGSAFTPTVMLIADNGTGIPIEKPKGETRSALEIVTSHVHGGGKFKDAGAYAASIGTHGVGIKATNALSSSFSAYTFRNKKWHVIHYKDSKLVKPPAEASALELKSLWGELGETRKRGTVIRFSPDYSFFDKGSFLSIADLTHWFELRAYFNSGIKFRMEYSQSKKEDFKVLEFYHDDGLNDYMKMRLKELKCELMTDNHFSVHTPHLDVILAFSDADGCKVDSYTNTMYNSVGGNHQRSTFNMISDALAPYAGKHDFHKDDIREGVVGLINFKIDTPKFASQTKERLADPRFEILCTEELEQALAKFFKKNKELAQQLCERAARLRSLKEQFSLTKKAAGALKKMRTGSNLLPGKLTEVKECPVAERELFTVEGDSAAGTAKSARMKSPYRYQETLALKGKILNVIKEVQKGKGDAIWDSVEVQCILVSMGYKPESKDPLKDLRIGKFIIMADADDDGAHIAMLQIALIAKFLPAMFDMGMVYIADLPKRMVTIKEKGRDKMYFGNTVDEIQKQIPHIKNPPIVYLKGLGEMSENALRETAFDPATRKLIKIMPASASELLDIDRLMGVDTSERKRLLGIESE
ncbi:DNA topoisomerase II large subunit [Pseudomonas phage vB_PpuM-Voja-6]